MNYINDEMDKRYQNIIDKQRAAGEGTEVAYAVIIDDLLKSHRCAVEVIEKLEEKLEEYRSETTDSDMPAMLAVLMLADEYLMESGDRKKSKFYKSHLKIVK